MFWGRVRPGSLSRFSFSSSHRDDEGAVADGERSVDGFGESAADRRTGGETVDDDFDVVPHLAIEGEIVTEIDDFAVDAGTDEALLAQLFEEVAVLALLAADHRGEDGELRLRREHEDAADDLLAGLRGDRPAALGAMAAADAGEEDAEEIVDFGDRADGRAGIVAGRFLRDRDRRAEAADVVDLGLRHLAEELAGEGGQTFHVAPLAFGVKRIERERAFAGAGNAGQANELVSRQGHVDAAEVVLASALDDDIGSGHQCAGGGSWRGQPRRKRELAIL